ncbi:MAG: glycosyltransferase family 2 protein, partial [Pseudomonadota bacterium]
SLDDTGQTGTGCRLFIFNGNLNHQKDIHDLLRRMKEKVNRQDRLCLCSYNPYMKFIFYLSTKLGLRYGPLPSTFLTKVDLKNFCKLTGWEIIRIRRVGTPALYLPFVGKFINKIWQIIPFIREFCHLYLILLRPIKEQKSQPTLSVIVPALNEEGNVPMIFQGFRALSEIPLEVIFVEGNSQDKTFHRIQQEIDKNPSLNARLLKQTGKGKFNAVIEAIEISQSDLITILDADLTVPPENILLFYQTYKSGIADFINGHRLLYPMQNGAMQFLNLLGNIFFAKVMSYVLDVSIGDTLCGTKMFTRLDYQRFKKWNSEKNIRDPFGDFSFLAPAGGLGLGIIDIPVRYQSRRYGKTNIQRFRDGLLLLKMTLVLFVKNKL